VGHIGNDEMREMWKILEKEKRKSEKNLDDILLIVYQLGNMGNDEMWETWKTVGRREE